VKDDMADVIDLSVFKRRKEEKKFDELVEKMEEQEKNLALLTIDAVLASLDRLSEFDIDPRDNPRSIVDLYLIIEATAGLISRLRGDTHSIHKAADMFMDEDYPSDPFEWTANHEKMMNEFFYGDKES
jgi:hypothetical protein